MEADFLPALSPNDVDRAAQLIRRAYSPIVVNPEDQKRIQQELFMIQKHSHAWGLFVPLLQSPEPNVRFFGAHTIQVKIARDWDTLPENHRVQLRQLLLDLISRSVLAGHEKVVHRKLYVALTALAMHLATIPNQWPNWLMNCVAYFSNEGVPAYAILDFLAIVAEEIGSADLVASAKLQMQQSLLDAVPTVVHAITNAIATPQIGTINNELPSALRCLNAWISNLRVSELTDILPRLIQLLEPKAASDVQSNAEFDSSIFLPAAETLEEVLSKSPGVGSKILTEPLLVWCERWGARLLEITLEGSDRSLSHAFCKLLVAISDHSTSYLACNVASPQPAMETPFTSSTLTRAHVIQNFLRLILAFTGLPGLYGIDEEDSEMTLGFWYLFQEALWNAEYNSDGWEEEVNDVQNAQTRIQNEKEQWIVVEAVYAELVQVLRAKVVWPRSEILVSWTHDQVEKFEYYRRDVGDTLINAYYVLRDKLLGFYIDDIDKRLSMTLGQHGWEEIEATLHCISSVQEAVPLNDSPHLVKLFGPEILGKFPTSGQHRVRRTTTSLIGAYATWFTTQVPSSPSAVPSTLFIAIGYVVTALPEPALCLAAANALRDLCDSNRTALALHIDAFAELHANLTLIPDTERAKVLQSIASVIQALPPEQQISPVEAIVGPVIQKLIDAIQSCARAPEEARAAATMQLQTITAVAKGFTRSPDLTFSLDESPEDLVGVERIKAARLDSRMVKVREDLFSAINSAVNLWSVDASASDALSDTFKAITCLPYEITLISLPSGPLLELVCLACKRQLTATWLTLARILIIQLDCPSSVITPIKQGPDAESHAIVSNLLPVLLETSLTFLGQPGAMTANPDIVQAFFSCMEPITLHFLPSLFRLPPGGLDSLVQCAISSISLQERYSLVSACTYLGTLITRVSTREEYAEIKIALLRSHGRAIMSAILNGFAGVTPRSAMPNLIELLSTMVTHSLQECRTWMAEILFDENFMPSKAGPEVKEKFLKAVIGSRSIKRTREAAQQFMLIARGLERTSFGYGTVSM